MNDKKGDRPLLTKQDIKDFAIAAAVTGGLEVLLKSEGTPLTVGEMAFDSLLWGGAVGYFRSKQLGTDEGFRAGFASAAGAIAGNICGYVINNYGTFVMPFM